ncbi:MAG: hypothetical protein AB8F78_05485 [Saprospiraceae bacterium]
MRTYIQTVLFLVVLFASSMAIAQDDGNPNESPVRLEYVVAQNNGTANAGSFVVKNNYSTRTLSAHVLAWELSYKGEAIQDGAFPLDEVKSGDTKYVKLKDLLDLTVLEDLNDGLVSLFAEVQWLNGEKDPIRIVGESVVLAEAKKKALAKPEKYHVIKVGGARIHRIANGNSVTLDIFNQMVALDLGEGNLLAGPIRPILIFESDASDTVGLSLSQKQAQHQIDSLGPTRVELDDTNLLGVIEYDLDTFGLLKLPFALTENGLRIGIKIEGGLIIPSSLGIEAPVRMLGDSAMYLGQSYRSDVPEFGDAKLGHFYMPADTMLLGSQLETSILDTRVISTERGDIHGIPFTFQLRPITEDNQNYVGLSSHPMEAGTHILYLNRLNDRRFGYRKSTPISGGEWLFAPKVKKD